MADSPRELSRLACSLRRTQCFLSKLFAEHGSVSHLNFQAPNDVLRNDCAILPVETTCRSVPFKELEHGDVFVFAWHVGMEFLVAVARWRGGVK